MAPRTRVVAAMSGGVDSSVAAALLQDAGHDVIGLSMQLYDQREGLPQFGGCCGLDDLHDARRVTARLGIPYYVVNLQREFEQIVVRDFVTEYVAGRTPLPCAHCNSALKFTSLLDRAVGLGAPHVATGHYARVERDPTSGRFVLRRGCDSAKDQAYFLFSLTQAQLSCALFPLGTWTKADVRRYARQRGLPVAEKRESQEICFVADGDYASFVERHAPSSDRAGIIVDEAGRVVGRHRGVHHFTVGQRKGLGLSSPDPLYVTELDAAARTVRVGPRSALERSSLTASRVNWIAGEAPLGVIAVQAQIRYRHAAADARVEPIGRGQVRVRFDTPQRAITPGQAVVWYDGDAVLGGGWID